MWKVVPQLADSYELSLDELTWTFHIRQGVTFYNGASLTPSDVAYSFQRGLLQGGSSSPQWLLAEPFFGIGVTDVSFLVDPSGGLLDDRTALSAADPVDLVAACNQVKAAIVADDAADTVTMHMAQPWGPFLTTIAGPVGSITDKAWTIDQGSWDGSCDTWQDWYALNSSEDPLTEIANGTGPFQLDHWTRGAEVVLTRNNNYWRTPAALQRVEIRMVSDETARFTMLQTGQADESRSITGHITSADGLVGEDCIWSVATAQYDCSVVNSTKPLRRYKGRPNISQNEVLFNFDIDTASGSNPFIGSGALDGDGIPTDFFADEHIRKAFNYCFDWEAFGQSAYGGEYLQPTTLLLEGMPGYDLNAPHYIFDLAKCAQEFGQADVDHDSIPSSADNDDVTQVGFRVQVVYNEGNSIRQTIADVLAADLAQVNPKFVVEVVGLPWLDYLAAQNASRLPLFVSGWLEDVHDPHNWYQPYLVGTYGSRARIPASLKAQFSVLIDQGVSETDFATRSAIYGQLNQLIYDNAPFILVGGGVEHSFIQRQVLDRVLNPIFPGNYYYPINKAPKKSATLMSVAAHDGWILESKETSNKGGTLNSKATTFYLGDNTQKKQYRLVLSFSTKSLPDNAVITKVTLKVKKQGVAGGGNPVNTFRGFMVDVKKGFFGSAATLQTSDFQTTPNKSFGPFKPALAGGWYTINLTPAKAYINKLATRGGVTQLRLRFKLDDNNNTVANYLSLYSGNAPTASRPKLILEYYVP